MIYVLAALAAIATGFVLGRLSYNIVSDIWLYMFPPLETEAPPDCRDFKNAGAAVGAVAALAWCEIALVCGSPLWAVLGCILGGFAIPLLGLALVGLGVAILVVFVLCLVLLGDACKALALVCCTAGSRVDRGYARIKAALADN